MGFLYVVLMQIITFLHPACLRNFFPQLFFNSSSPKILNLGCEDYIRVGKKHDKTIPLTANYGLDLIPL
jgi:hypothetical protein